MTNLEMKKLLARTGASESEVEASVKGKDKKQVMELTEEELSCVNGGKRHAE